LVRDRMRIAVVARQLGYESEAAFSRAFKRIIGAPPSRFRATQAEFNGNPQQRSAAPQP
jgi:AraC-like DNA-binding protein